MYILYAYVHPVPGFYASHFAYFPEIQNLLLIADKVIYINKNKINFKVNSLKWKAKQNNKVKKFS